MSDNENCRRPPHRSCPAYQAAGGSGGQAPAAAPQGVTTYANTPVTFSLAGRSSSSETIVYTLATAPQHGTVTFDADQATYTCQRAPKTGQ